MKKPFVGWLALVMAVLLAACGAPPPGQSAGESSPPPGQTAGPETPPAPEADKAAALPESAAEPEQGEAPPESDSEPEQGETPPESTAEPEQGEAPPESAAEPGEGETPENTLTVTEDGWYNTKDEVALYIHLYNRLPENYVTKNEAEKKGWRGGNVEKYTGEGTAIGGSRFGNYEGLLPEAKGRKYTECDINTVGRKQRGAERIIFSNDGLIYYTGDHYKSFEQLYGES